MTPKRVGRYVVEGELGAGANGRVLLGRDERLDRRVALKLLAGAPAGEAASRLQAEARALAAVRHPGLAAVLGLEHHGELCFLVLEHAGGRTLAERLSEGALPLAEALSVGAQLADVLQSVHEAGVVHRDVSASNIVVSGGVVRLLDFGLAQLRGEGVATGLAAGTPGYASPELTRGWPVDARTDVWSFGHVLYRCLTASAEVPADPADWTLPRGTPSRVRELLVRCLTPERERRLQEIGHARLVLEELMAAPAGARSSGRLERFAPWIAAALLLAALLGLRMLEPVDRTVLHADLSLSLPAPLYLHHGSSVSLAGDGAVLVATVRDGTVMRSLDEDDWRIGKLRFVRNPRISRDGGFVVGHTVTGLLRQSLDGRGATVVTSVRADVRGFSPAPDGSVVLAPSTSGGLVTVTIEGEQRALTSLESRGEVSHRWPHHSPDGRVLTYTAKTEDTATFDDARIVARRLDTMEEAVLVEGGTDGRIVSSGHLVFARAGALWAAPVGETGLRTLGEPVRVRDDVAVSPLTGESHHDLGLDGTLVHAMGGVLRHSSRVVRLDRDGTTTELISRDGQVLHARPSPDGRHLAYILSGANDRLMVRELHSGRTWSPTAGHGNDQLPAWSPDGRRIAVVSDRRGGSALLVVTLDGEETLVHASSQHFHRASFSPAGSRLVFSVQSEETGWDLFVVAADGTSPAEPWLVTRLDDQDPDWSPDGRWIAWVSTDSGLSRVQLRAADGTGPIVSVAGGASSRPLWSGAGTLHYRRPGGLHVADVVVDDGALRVTGERLWITAGRSEAIEPSRDGETLFRTLVESPAAPRRLRVVLGWTDELVHRVPTTR